MEPASAKSFPVARDPPPQKAQMGQGPEPHGWWRWAFLALVSLVLAGRFGWDVYLARHSARNLAFVVVTYDLVAVLCCCLAKLNLLRRPSGGGVRIVVWVLSVALATIIAARVALVMPGLRLKIAVLAIAGVSIGLSFYSFARADGGRHTDDMPLHTVSPEPRV